MSATKDATFTMDPPPASIMAGTAARQHSHTPFRLTSITRSQVSGGRVEDAAVVAGEDAGVVEQDVQGAEVAHRRVHHVGDLCLVGHVAPTADARPPAPVIEATVSRAASATTSATTTAAPSEANSCAATRPMPLPAPVITATLPSSRPGMRRPYSGARGAPRQSDSGRATRM